MSNGPAPYSESYAYDSAGRLSSKSGLGSYTYDTTHKHAVASTANGWAYQYDPNGNQFRRDPPGAEVFDFAYDAENHLVEAKKNGVTLATFVYDGDGRRVKTTLNGSTLVYVGDYLEVCVSGCNTLVPTPTPTPPAATATPTRTPTPASTPTPTPKFPPPKITKTPEPTLCPTCMMGAGRSALSGPDGGQVMSVPEGQTWRLYYYAGSDRVAMREQTASSDTLYYLLPDHLGSTSLTSDANGAKLAELRYRAWGETRYNSGSTPTRYQYTGQYSYTADFGLYFYNARWYDPTLGRFAQPEGLPLFSKISAIEPGVRCLMAWQTAIP